MQAPLITLVDGLPPLGLVAAAVLLVFLPGYAVAVALLPAPRYTVVERVLAAPALTVALLAVAVLWATTAGLPLGHPAAVGLVLVAAAVGLAGTVRHRPALQPAAWRPWLLVGSYLALFGLALGLRLWSTREVLPTLGADTYHHMLIAQLLVERRGLPDSYAPYAAIHSFAYHFGFHSLAAWLHWWTGANVGVLVPLAGHLVNAAVALAVAFFAQRLLGQGLAAWLAAWLIALICVFPAYFVNWGRFTQASGLLLLPVAAGCWLGLVSGMAGPRWRASDLARASRAGLQDGVARATALLPEGSCYAEERCGRTREALAAGLATAGLALTHYRMALVLLLLVGVWAAYLALRCLLRRGDGLPRLLTRRRATGGAAPEPGRGEGVGGVAPWPALGWGLVPGLVGGLLGGPWLVHLWTALPLEPVVRPGAYGVEYFALERLGSAAGQPSNGLLGVLGLLGLLLAWRRRVAGVLVLLASAGGLLALANPYWWPGAWPFVGQVDLVTTIATLYFPVAVAAAYALAAGFDAARRRGPRPALVGGLALGLLGTIYGGWQLQALITPANALVTPADLAAAAWLRANTPPDARIAVSAVIFPWAPDYVVGIDGGYWLPLLARRATTVLPMVYPAERGTDRRAVEEMVAVARALRDAPAAPETVRLLRTLGVSYLYHSGRPGAPPLDGALANAAYVLVYEHEGVRVLAVRPE